MNTEKKSLVGIVILCSLLSVCALIGLLGIAPAQAAVPSAPITAPASPLATTWVVTSSADSGLGSLRAAIASAAAGDTIHFNADYTITLSSELVINKALTIDGETHNVTVSGNHATRVFNVTATSGIVTLNHLTIANGNLTTTDCPFGIYGCGSGVVIRNSGVTVNVTNSTLSGNSTPGDGTGGGIANNYGTLNVINSTLSGNSASGVGGGIINTYGMLNVTNSTFSGNSAPGGTGGGIYNEYGTLTVINSTFSGNSATYFGTSIFNGSSGTLTVTNSTFSGNSSTYFAGSIYNGSSGLVTVKNSIVANNSGGNCIGAIGGANNLTNDATCGSSFTNSSTILLGALGNYGGSTHTIPLLPGSAAIHVASSNCPATDQRGITRGTTCDLGAFESQGFTLVKVSGDSQSTPVNTVFTQPLVISVTSAFNEPVNGGAVTFVGPLSGAGINPITATATITNDAVAHGITANGLPGSYLVDARATGATSIIFTLRNLARVYLPLMMK